MYVYNREYQGGHHSISGGGGGGSGAFLNFEKTLIGYIIYLFQMEGGER